MMTLVDFSTLQGHHSPADGGKWQTTSKHFTKESEEDDCRTGTIMSQVSKEVKLNRILHSLKFIKVRAFREMMVYGLTLAIH